METNRKEKHDRMMTMIERENAKNTREIYIFAQYGQFYQRLETADLKFYTIV